MMEGKIKKWREMADDAQAKYRTAKGGLKAARTAVIEGEDAYANAEEAQQIVQAVSESIQEEAHSRIGGVVTRCLQAVFDDPYAFHIRFERARGRTEARLVFVRDGMEINPIDASGGGVIDVAAFALRLSCLMLARPARRRLVVLDEPFRFVSENLRERVRLMLENLSKELSVQFVVITHMTALETGHVVRIGCSS